MFSFATACFTGWGRIQGRTSKNLLKIDPLDAEATKLSNSLMNP
jgi:hypothetical protein